MSVQYKSGFQNLIQNGVGGNNDPIEFRYLVATGGCMHVFFSRLCNSVWVYHLFLFFCFLLFQFFSLSIFVWLKFLMIGTIISPNGGGVIVRITIYLSSLFFSLDVVQTTGTTYIYLYIYIFFFLFCSLCLSFSSVGIFQTLYFLS
jgi:hypothetical protein